MITGTTKSGFSFEIKESAIDDMEFMEMVADVEDNPVLVPKVIEHMLGKEQKQKLYDHLRTEEGNVPVQAMLDEMEDIFTRAEPLKK